MPTITLLHFLMQVCRHNPLRSHFNEHSSEQIIDKLVLGATLYTRRWTSLTVNNTSNIRITATFIFLQQKNLNKNQF